MAESPGNGNRKWKVALVAAIVCGPLLGALGSAWAVQSFNDVPSTHPFFDEIEWGASNGIIDGYNDGSFRPEGPLKRQAAAAFLARYNNSIHEVSQQSAYNNPNSSFQTTATCPVGERAISGSGQVSVSDVFMTDSYGSGRDWTVRWESEDNDPKTLSIIVHATCAPDVTN